MMLNNLRVLRFAKLKAEMIFVFAICPLLWLFSFEAFYILQFHFFFQKKIAKFTKLCTKNTQRKWLLSFLNKDEVLVEDEIIRKQ